MAKDWLDEILEGTDETESPKQYYYWSALCAISAVCKRNVYLNQFRFNLYPNIFVFLVGKSGIRKGPPVALAVRLVEAVGNTKVFTGRASIQGITKEMGTARTNENGQPMMTDASAFIGAGEFSSSLIGDPDALTILTDLYDTHNHRAWKNTLVGREGEVLKNPYLVMLGASNQVHLKEVIEQRDVEGGFIARTFIINAGKKHKKYSLVRPPSKNLNEQKAIEYLKEIASLRGEFHYVDGADDVYDEWYHKFDDEKEDVTGTRARIHTSVLKIAMLLSLSKRLTLELKPDDITDALAACGELITDMNKVFLPGKGTETDFGKMIAIVINDLLNSPTRSVTRQQLMSKHWGYLHRDTLDPVIETLIQPGIVRVTQNGNKASAITYTLTEEGYQALIQLDNANFTVEGDADSYGKKGKDAK